MLPNTYPVNAANVWKGEGCRPSRRSKGRSARRCEASLTSQYGQHIGVQICMIPLLTLRIITLYGSNRSSNMDPPPKDHVPFQPVTIEKRSAHDHPVYANFDCSHLTVGAGVAIFHLATSRVVLCFHSARKYWFLPKGRRDANEETCAGAEREGFEEVHTPCPV